MFRRLRWLSILVPVAIVTAIETLSDTFLDADLPFPLDAALIAGVVFVAAATLSWLAFRQIDRLSQTLQARNEDLEARNATARGLQEVAVAVASGAHLSSTLETVVEQSRILLQGDLAVLEAWLPGEPQIRVVRPAADTPVATGLDGPSLEERLDAAGFRVRLVTPIRMGGSDSGTLAAARRSGSGFDVEQVETITALASMAAVALRNHALRGGVRELAIRGERERIAREMHDGLAQVLAYVSAKSAAADQLLAAGRVPEARAQMAELGTAARSTYVDVREAILGLTTPVSAEQGLAAAIEEYAARFADAAKIAVAVSASPPARAADLSAEAEAQTFRIVQEALTNVRKHAQAARVEIVLDVGPGCLTVVIRDDGRGLPQDPGRSADWPHYGLATMAARAAEVGGRVRWHSDEGGTCIELAVPLVKAALVGRPPVAASA